MDNGNGHGTVSSSPESGMTGTDFRLTAKADEG